MSQQSMGYLIGGVLPALILGVFSILQKLSTKNGISPGMFLIVVGINIIAVGLVYCFFANEFAVSWRSGFYASLTGIAWAVATGLVSYTLAKYQIPISKLVPIFNMNTLVAVCLGLIVFAEWKNINMPKLFIASILIVAGGTLASKA